MNRKERISRVNTDRMAFWASLAHSSACTTSQEHLKSSMSVPICHIRKEDRMVQIEGPTNQNRCVSRVRIVPDCGFIDHYQYQELDKFIPADYQSLLYHCLFTL